MKEQAETQEKGKATQEKVLAVVGTPFVKGKDRISVLVDPETSLINSVKAATTIARKKGLDDVAADIEGVLGKPNFQIRIDGQGKPVDDPISEYATIKKGKEGKKDRLYSPLEVVDVNAGGYNAFYV